MNPDLLSAIRKLPLNPQMLAAALPLITRYGLAGAVVLARGYLGPLAHRAAESQGGGGEPAEPSAATTDRGTGKLDPRDAAVLGLALTKLVYELGELALHNPTLDPAGPQPEFKLDERGHAPAMSVSHVLAAARLWQQHAARRETERQAREAAEEAAFRRSPRAQLQAARSERYAATPRYSYVAPTATPRVRR